jgi:hypothetical protein
MKYFMYYLVTVHFKRKHVGAETLTTGWMIPLGVNIPTGMVSTE